MTLDDIYQIIAHEESRVVEYKQSIAELGKLGKAICGFLNTQGGIGILGITDKKKVIGIEVTDATKKKLAIFCNHFDPWPSLTIHYVALPDTDKQVVAIEAKPNKENMPFTYRGTPYLRNESTLNKMPAELYKQRLLELQGYLKRGNPYPPMAIPSQI